VSNPDSFIEEVSEEVRRDRLYRAFRKYGWIGILGVVLIVGGAAWNELRKARATAAAEAYGDALYAALEREQAENRLLALEDVATPEGSQAVTGLIMATEAQAQSQAASAEALKAVIVNPETPSLYRELAQLRLAMLGEEAVPASERQAALQALTQGNGPFRLLALEQRALIEADSGQTDAALETLRGLVDAADATEAQRQRALQLIVALGGEIAQG